MHREIRHTGEVFDEHNNLALYLLTALVGVLIGIDIWPAVMGWLLDQGVELPTWSRDFYGFRFALFAAVIGGARILYGSLESLADGRIGADLALAVAAIAAILIGEPLVAAEVVFIGMFGECLEAITFGRTQAAIAKLVELFPKKCWVLRDGAEQRVFTHEVNVGDQVVVKPGGKVPVDGSIVAGQSSVNASALTGESIPIDKSVGDEVLAGSVNQFGALTIEATRVKEQTVAGQVIELTNRALQDKSKVERRADQLAKYFLPAVLGLALITFLGYLIYYSGPIRSADDRLALTTAARLSVYPTLAVLVVACPCALILATPAAVIAALGRLAGTGVLIKGGAALERLAIADVIAFDKTGTLTEGKLELGDVITIGDIPANEVVHIAALAEQGSEHPIARLILAEASRRGIDIASVEEFQAHAGAGVSAHSGADVLLVGNQKLFEQHSIELPPSVAEHLTRLDAEGQTSLIVARGNTILGLIGARDTIRPEAAGVIAELRELGFHRVLLLTGDRGAVATAVATQLPEGVETHAELLPAQKAEFLTMAGPSVMVGDGVNDAPALASASVGIAIGRGGTDIAAEAGDIVLMSEPLRPLPFLVRLSRQTLTIIQQNILIFAFGVNLVGVVITAWLWPLFASSPGWYESSPLAAVIYHQIGSLAVLLNSMRLLTFERAAQSRTVRSVRESLAGLDGWMERNLSFDRFLHGLADRWKPIAGSLLLIGGSLYALSGLQQIDADEIGVVQRFGRVEEQLEPGLSWRWPWPIETVTEFRPNEVRTIAIGFRYGDPGPEADGSTGFTWASAHADSSRRVSDESVMITGDGNLIEILATIRYRVTDPNRYLFGVADPDAIIRSAAESVLREQVSGSDFVELLTVRREGFGHDVLVRLEQRCAEMMPGGLGVKFEGLALHDIHPPQEVVSAYHDVARAMERRDRWINESEADAMRTDRGARRNGLVITTQAEAKSAEQIADARADHDVFLAWHRARTHLSKHLEARLACEALGLILAGDNAAVVLADYRDRREKLLSSQRFLIGFRRSWDALTTALKGRDKILIDAEGLPGRRQLLLLDPDTLRMPPFLPGGQPERGPLEP